MAALSLWPYQGIPDNPAAWLTRVARNKSIDQLRRKQKEQAYDSSIDARVIPLDADAAEEIIQDQDLRLIRQQIQQLVRNRGL